MAREGESSRPARRHMFQALIRSIVRTLQTICGPRHILWLHTPARHPALRHDSTTRHQRNSGWPSSDGGDGRRGQAGRRVAPDGLARDQRQRRTCAPRPRQRVLAAMRKLDYRPNPVARALVTGRSRTLGVVSFDTTLYGPASTLFAIEQAAHGGRLLHQHRQPPRPRPRPRAGRRRAPARAGRRRHLVIAPQEARGRRARQPARRRPGGGGRGRPPQLRAARGRRPGRRGASTPRSCLLDLGHETVWHVSGPRDWLEAQRPRRRLARRRWRPPARRGPAGAGRRLEPARRATGSACELADDPDVTAVFVANDQMALGVLRALHERGARDPARRERRRLRRHPRGGVLHARRSPRCGRTSARWAAAACACCSSSCRTPVSPLSG